MRQTVTGLAEKPVDAQKIIDDLIALCVCDRSDISLMAGENSGQASAKLVGAARAAGQVAAVAGATAASALGGILGVASDVVSRKVSGFGALNAVGQLATTLSRTALGTARDLAGALVDFGMEQEHAREYADALQRGSILIVVDAKTDNMAQCARRVLATHGAASPVAHAGHQ